MPASGEEAATAEQREFHRLSARLRSAFREWEETGEAWPERRFEELSAEAFALQYEANRPYRLYCRARGETPGSVSGWRGIPPVPTVAFREVPLVVGDPADAELEFVTSGTTRGPARRGRHLVRDPGLYRASAQAAFRRFVLDGRPRAPFCSLVPPFRESTSSSLAWMVETVMRRFGEAGSRHAAGSAGIDWAEAEEFVRLSRAEERPVCVVATTLALEEWTRSLEREGRTLELAPGSTIVDTGGAKGRQGVSRARVVDRARRVLGLRPTQLINEFGMTELLSQRYSRRGNAPEAPHLGAPPWLRTRALDPVTLEGLPPGEIGVLCHLDLANLGSVCAVLTEDLGRVRDGAVEVVGRSPGARPRGCSLATAELLEAQGHG